MISTQKLVDHIKECEGYNKTAVRIPSGLYMIGYRHFGGVKKDALISKDEADFYLDIDIEAIESYLMSLKIKGLNIARWEALVDFLFSLNVSVFKNSTVMKKIRENVNDRSIADEFLKYDYTVLDSTIIRNESVRKRRQWEARRWMTILD